MTPAEYEMFESMSGPRQYTKPARYGSLFGQSIYLGSVLLVTYVGT